MFTSSVAERRTSTFRIRSPIAPAPSSPDRLQVIVKTRSRDELPRVLQAALEELRGARRVPRDLVIDVVPDSML